MLETQPEPERKAPCGNMGRIAYSIDFDQRIVLETWSGRISDVVLDRHWSACLSDPQVLGIKRTLADLRHCEVTFTGRQWVETIERFVLANEALSGWQSAIVVNQSYIYGIARQFLSYTSDFITGQIFDSPSDAFDWLARSQSD